MSSIPSNISRVSSAMSRQMLLGDLRQSHVEMLKTQEQLSSGKRINHPSDAPESIGIVQTLRGILDEQDQRLSGLDRTSGMIDVTDSALGEVTELVREAHTLASSQIGVGSDADTRRNQAEVVQGMIDQLNDIANRSHRGVRLFGGRQSSDQPFVGALGGIRYTGAEQDLTNDLGTVEPLAINTNGADALGALSSRVQGDVDLDPDATGSTRIRDVRGARGEGVTLGTVRVTVNGTPTEVDLSGADTLGDVRDRLNDTIGGAGSVSVTADGFTLTAGAGNTVSIADIGTGITAQDLGLDISATAGSTTGGDLDPRLTPRTDLSQLGASVDLTGGLKITNGGTTRVVDLSGVSSVEQMINKVAAADIGVRMSIADDGRTLRLVNEVSGTELSVGENAGGTTAGDLGLRSLDTSTALDDFNHGEGVRIASGEDDFRIELADGTAIDVNLDGAQTVADVIGAINTAGGGSVTATLAADGNGLVLNDTTAGASDFRVTALNNSRAAEDLGIRKNAGGSATLSGDDNATIRTDSVFTHLRMLRDALLNNDERGITEAGEKLSADTDRIATVRAKTGVRGQRLEDERQRTEDRQLQTESMLSELRDTDYPEAITKLTQLQQQLQATLQVGQRVQQLSLFQFLR